MDKVEHTTNPTQSVDESNVCSPNVCSPDRTNPETEHTFSTSSERSENRLKRILNVLYGILAEDYYFDDDSKNTPGHKNSERSECPVQIIRLARTVNLIHEKVNTIITMLDTLDEKHDEDMTRLAGKINMILPLVQTNNSMCYSIREHAKHAKESLAIITENTTINKQAYGTLVSKLEELPDCTNCWANMGEHKKSVAEMSDLISRESVLQILAGLARTQSEYNDSYDKLMQIPSERSESSTYKHIWKSKWSLVDYKKMFEDSRLVHFWFYLRNYLYAPVQDILTDCAEYLFKWMHNEISAYCSEPTDDISEVQDINIYLDRMATFYDLVQSHKDDMPEDRYDSYMHILSDIDILLSERSDSEVSKLGGADSD